MRTIIKLRRHHGTHTLAHRGQERQMSKLSELFGQRENDANSIDALLSDPPPAPIPAEASAPKAENTTPPQPDARIDSSAKIGEENEALRNLLVDAGMKIRQFDDYKNIFVKLIEPATQA